MKISQAVRLTVFGFFLILIASVKMFAAGGDLDVTFNAGVASFGSTANVVVVQSDGRILVGGNFRVVNGRSSQGLVRLNADGTIDQSFNIGTGVNAGATVNAIAVQPDGKILVGGAFSEFNGVTQLILVRLNADGSLDTSFNMGGAGITNGFSVDAITLQPNGQILVGGYFFDYNGATVGNLARLNSNGALDTAFNTNLGTGIEPGGRVNTIAVEPDGQIVVGGGFGSVNNTTAFNIARLNSTGTLDTAFITNTGTGFNFAVNEVALQTDGRIVVGGGFTTFNGTNQQRLARLNSNGTLDTGYNQGSNGQAVLSGNYGNLTFSNFNKNLTGATIGIAGTFTPGNAAGHTITGSTFNFNGAAQTIPAFTFNHLSTSGSGTKTLGGAGAVLGNLIIGSGTTLDVSANNFALNVGGNFTNNGAFVPQAGTVTFNGAAAQTIGGASATNFNNLTINNAAGVAMSGNSTVANLTLSSGNLSTGANTLTITGTITRASGYVIGNLRKNLSAGNTFTFTIGTANGYSPVTVNLTSGTTEVTATVTQTNHPALNPATSLRRYWTLTGTGTFTANLTFNYLQDDVFGNESNYRITRVSSGISQVYANNCAAGSPCVNTGANTAFISGVTQFSDWTLSEAVPTAASVTVAGRVLAFKGRGISNARVSMTNGNGETRYAMTNPFGFYRFADVPAGETYILSVRSKWHQFNPPTRVLFVSEDITDADFVAAP